MADLTARQQSQKNTANALRTFTVGVLIGIANIVPGVSGSTIAVIFGLYDRFIALMALDIKMIRKHWLFALLLVGGMGIGVLVFSQVIRYLRAQFPLQTGFLFLGIILGSLPVLFGKLRGGGMKAETAVPFALMFAVMALTRAFSTAASASPQGETLEAFALVRLCAVSAVTTAAMVMPGISGSLLALIMGAYDTVIYVSSSIGVAALMLVGAYAGPLTFAELPFLPLISLGLGGLVGLVGGARLVRMCMRRFPSATYSAICGLVTGSLLTTYPGFSFTWSGLAALLCCAAGALGIYRLSLSGQA